MRQALAISFLALFLASCGGGGGSSSPSVSTPPPPPPPTGSGATNSAPTITSVSNVTVDEFQTGKVYTLTAEDSDGTVDSLAMSSTADAGFFTFLPDTGELFLTDPLTTPADQGSNNIYDLEFVATDDDGATGTLAFSVSVTDAGPPPS